MNNEPVFRIKYELLTQNCIFLRKMEQLYIPKRNIYICSDNKINIAEKTVKDKLQDIIDDIHVFNNRRISDYNSYKCLDIDRLSRYHILSKNYRKK